MRFLKGFCDYINGSCFDTCIEYVEECILSSTLLPISYVPQANIFGKGYFKNYETTGKIRDYYERVFIVPCF